MRKSLLVLLLVSSMSMMLFAQSGNPPETNLNQTNPNWTKLPIPPAMSDHLHSIIASSDGYVYADSDSGIFRAAVTNPTVWSAVNNGLPKIAGAYPPAMALEVTARGTLLAGLGFGPEYGIARLDPRTLTWSMARGPSHYGNEAFTAFTHDAAGNEYATDYWNGNVYRSTDDGLNFTLQIANAYNHMGQTAGAIWAALTVKDSNGVELIYWGGEGNLNISSLDFTQNQTALTVTQGYAGNLRAIAASSGTEVLVGKGMGATRLQRFDLSTQRWTSIGSAQGLPSYWNIIKIKYLAATREYFATLANGNYGGVFRSGDGGKTWATYSTGMPPLAAAAARKLAISPVSHAKFVTSGSDIWYCP